MHPAHPKDKQPGIKAFCVLHAFLHCQNNNSPSMRHSSTVQFHNAKGTKLSAKCCLDKQHVRNEPPPSSKGRRDQRERTTLPFNTLAPISTRFKFSRALKRTEQTYHMNDVCDNEPLRHTCLLCCDATPKAPVIHPLLTPIILEKARFVPSMNHNLSQRTSKFPNPF